MHMSTENVEIISAGQCRAGRALLDITQPDLASRAGLGLSTIVDFERARRPVSSAAIRAICTALQTAGIEFIDENGGGAGVRFRNQQPKNE